MCVYHGVSTMSFDYKNYEGTRARCQRIEDAKLFRGWIRSFDENEIQVQFEEKVPLAPSERMAFELQGITQNIFVLGEVIEINDQVGHFRLTSSLRLSTPTESVRFQATRFGIFCDLEYEGEIYDMDVSDISSGGIGLTGAVDLPKGKSVKLQLHTSAGAAQAIGEVRYSKPGSEEGQFRVGLKLYFEDRISKGRWAKLFPTAA